MTDADLLLDRPSPEYGSGVIGVCDVCGKRQAVIVLSRERFKLCVIDFLNKSWVGSSAAPGAPLPPYRSERVVFPTSALPSGKAPAVLLSPTKIVRHPSVLVTPEVHGLTTSVLELGIRCAREGFEVLLPDLDRASAVGPRDHLSMRWGTRTRGGVPSGAPGVERLVRLYADALAYLRSAEMVDPAKTAVAGLSYGGSLAFLLAAREIGLSAVVLAYPAPVAPPEIARLLSAPTLLLSGRRDRLAGRAREQLAAAMPPGLLSAYDAGDVDHNFLGRDLATYRLGPAEASWREIVGFLKGRMMPPPPKPPAPPTRAPKAEASPTPAAAPGVPAQA